MAACNISRLTMMFYFYLSLVVFLATCIDPVISRPENDQGKPSFIQKMTDLLFPKVVVQFLNEGNQTKAMMCSFEKKRDELQLLKPGANVSFTFRDAFFPLYWCNVYINDTMQGVFWAYSDTLKCDFCDWRINDEGVYIMTTDSLHPNSPPFPRPQYLYTTGEYY